MSFVWRTCTQALATQMSHPPRSVPPPLRSARLLSGRGFSERMAERGMMQIYHRNWQVDVCVCVCPEETGKKCNNSGANEFLLLFFVLFYSF